MKLLCLHSAASPRELIERTKPAQTTTALFRYSFIGSSGRTCPKHRVQLSDGTNAIVVEAIMVPLFSQYVRDMEQFRFGIVESEQIKKGGKVSFDGNEYEALDVNEKMVSAYCNLHELSPQVAYFDCLLFEFSWY